MINTARLREHSIRGTYCDIATRIDGKLQMIIEVKAIGLELKDTHVKQAVDYAANQGIEWVALTNVHYWKVFRVMFTQPINAELVLDMDFLSLNPKDSAHLENLFLLTRESMIKSGLYAYHDQLQATNRFYLGAAILSDPVIEALRREIRRLSPDVRIQMEDLRTALKQDVLKRDVIDGDQAEAARRKMAKASGKMLRAKRTITTEPGPGAAESTDAEDSAGKP